MHKILEGVYMWTPPSTGEGELPQNGFYLRLGACSVLIDPPAMSDLDIAVVETLGRPSQIALTSREHIRSALELRERFGAKTLIHELDANMISEPIDDTFRDGDRVGDELRVIPVPDASSLGEVAFYWGARKTLVFGESMVGHPEGKLAIRDASANGDAQRARAGLLRLADIDATSVLVTVGEPVIGSGVEAMRAFVLG